MSRRTKDFLELWSGCFAAGRAAISRGFAAVPFDKFRDLGKTNVDGEFCEDLLCRSGFDNAVSATLEVRRGGFLLMAPTCSSMGFPNSSRCKRTIDNPWGNVGYDKVQTGNAEAHVCKFFINLGVARNLFVVVENPPGSWLWAILADEMQRYVTSVKTVPRCAFDDDPPGSKYFKPYKFASFATDADVANAIQNLQGKCQCPREVRNGRVIRKHLPLMIRNEAGGQCGRHGRLARSAAYPSRLGHALVLAWMGQSVLIEEDDMVLLGTTSHTGENNDDGFDAGSEVSSAEPPIEPESEASIVSERYEPSEEGSSDHI